MFEPNTSALQIPLYKLFYVNEISADPLTNDELARFYKEYDDTEIRRIIEGLEWASQHPEYPYASLVPGIRFSHDEAHRYLMNLFRQLQRHRHAAHDELRNDQGRMGDK